MADPLMKLPRPHVRRDLMPGGRFVKMLKPACPIASLPEDERPDDPCPEFGGRWWEDCVKRGHDPYFTTIRKGLPNEQRRPNLTQVALNIRVNSGEGITKAQRKGWKLPEEMGVAPFCQYLDCWSQDIQVRNNEYGDYCNEDQLKMVMADVNEVPLEVLNDRKRRRQLAQLGT